MKKIVNLVFCMLFAMLIPLQAIANEAETFAPYVIPDVSVNVEIRSASDSVIGLATVSLSPSLSVSTTVQIEKEIDGTWTPISTKVGATMVSTTASAESGASYRTYVYCVIYDSEGNIVDTASGYSAIITC